VRFIKHTILKVSAILNAKLRFYQTLHCIFKIQVFQISRFKNRYF
jgi:hypothetical protein